MPPNVPAAKCTRKGGSTCARGPAAAAATAAASELAGTGASDALAATVLECGDDGALMAVDRSKGRGERAVTPATGGVEKSGVTGTEADGAEWAVQSQWVAIRPGTSQCHALNCNARCHSDLVTAPHSPAAAGGRTTAGWRRRTGKKKKRRRNGWANRYLRGSITNKQQQAQTILLYECIRLL
jgi:hypothetical protein